LFAFGAFEDPREAIRGSGIVSLIKRISRRLDDVEATRGEQQRRSIGGD